MALNEKESKILSYIKENPFISQQDLATKIGLSRPAVANIISGLVRRGYLLGKAYVINDTRPIVCIGAACIDRRYFVEGGLIHGQSNNVTSQTSIGGVALSIAENLGRLQEDVVMLSLVGDDAEWHTIEESMRPLMKTSEVEMIPGFSTGTFMEVIDESGKMIIGLAEMDIYEYMQPKWLLKHLATLKRAKTIIIDSNCPKESVEHLLEIGAKYSIPTVLICASVLKLYNIPENLKGLKLLITKHDETEKHFGITIKDDASMREALQMWLDKGVQHVIITKNSQSVGYASENYGMHVYDLKNSDENSETYIWGTNEALCAGIVYSYLRTDEISEMIQTGLANAVMSSKSAYKVRPNLSQSVLRKDVKEIGKLESREI